MKIRVLTEIAYFKYDKPTLNYQISVDGFLYITEGKGKSEKTLATFNSYGWIGVFPSEEENEVDPMVLFQDTEPASDDEVH